MRNLKQIALILSLVVLFASYAHSLEVSFKISGGLSSFNLGNINRSLLDWQERHKKDTLNQPDWEFISGEFGKFHSGLNFGAEIVFSLSSHFAASFGIGYHYGEFTEDDSALTIKKGPDSFVYAWPTNVSIYPLTLSGYYFFPLGKKLSLFLKCGAGFMWAKFSDYGARKTLEDETFTYQFAQRASSKGTLILGGLGGTYEIEPGLSFFIEGSARFSEISRFHANEETETLYYYEEYNPSIEFWQAKNRVLAEAPSGEKIRSVQETVVDFSGFSVKIGLLIKF